MNRISGKVLRRNGSVLVQLLKGMECPEGARLCARGDYVTRLQFARQEPACPLTLQQHNVTAIRLKSVYRFPGRMSSSWYERPLSHELGIRQRCDRIFGANLNLHVLSPPKMQMFKLYHFGKEVSHVDDSGQLLHSIEQQISLFESCLILCIL
mmetsp:Transcript_42294/g.105351  ORF Transcript_42294/g.105351 Transcript_42294/m.105351 type:complete len:153 (-) Transcript_42294:1118-1576(-)